MLKPGDAVLADAELGRHVRLGEPERPAQLAQSHFLSDEFGGPLLDPAASLGVEPCNFIFHVQRHHEPPSLANRARCQSNRSSALRINVR